MMKIPGLILLCSSNMTHSYHISHDIHNSLTSANWMEAVAAHVVLVHVFVYHYKHIVNVFYCSYSF
jgi:hypothetical protein